MKMRNEGRRELDAPIGRRRKWWGGKEKRRMGKREGEGVGGWRKRQFGLFPLLFKK